MEYNDRAWLNPVESDDTGMIRARIEKNLWNPKHRHINAYLVIHDCDRNVTLNFDFKDEEKREERLRKVDALIVFLGEFREALSGFPLPGATDD